MKKYFKNYKLEIITLLIFFIFFAFLFYTFPYNGDDWGKESCSFFIALKNAWNAYFTFNGRFFGNFLASWFKYNSFMKIIISSLIVTCIVYIIGNFITIKGFKKYLLSFLLIILMPLHMFKDTISWLSSFVNFVIPGLSVITIIYLSRNLFEDKTEYKKYHSIIAVLCGLFMNLFAEHNSIFSIFLAIGLLLVSYLLKKKVYKVQVYFLISCVVFCLITFLSPVYWGDMPRLANATEFTSLSIIGKVFYNLTKSPWIACLSYENIIINFVIAFLFIINYKKFTTIIDKISLIIMLFITIILFPLTYFSVFNILTSHKIQLFLLIIYILDMLYILYRLFYKSDQKTFYKLICLFLSSYIIGIPLLLAYTIGFRCFFTSYLLLVVFACCLGDKLYYISVKMINLLMQIGTVLVMSLFIYISYCNNLNRLEINKIIEKSKNNNATFVILPDYPYPQIIRQKGKPRNEAQYGSFLAHYHLDNNAIINFINYNKYYSGKYDVNNFLKGLYIETYDGSDEPTHPTILKISTKNIPYDYLLGFTPLANSDPKLENPSILASNSAINWIKIDHSINPVVCQKKDNGLDYCSDPYLMEKDGIIELWYRFNPYNYQNEESKKYNSLIYRVTSTDGVNWSPSKLIFNKDRNEAYMSPSVLYENNRYKIYYVNYDNNVYYRESSNLESWSKPQKINFGELNGHIWHGELNKVNNRYEYLAYTIDDELYLSISNDNKNFKSTKKIDTSFLSRNNAQIYKSTYMIKRDKVFLYIPYLYKGKNKSTWQIFLKIYDKKEFYE